MKRVKVNLFGNVTYDASRSFVIELPDDASVETIDQQVLDDMADEARIAWNFGTEGYVLATDYTVEELGSEPSGLPIIPLTEKPST